MGKRLHTSSEFSEKEQKVLRAVQPSRLILPVFLGVGVVLYFLWRAFQRENLPELEWTTSAFLWLGLAMVLLACRHLAYTVRLWMLTSETFSFRKCVELVFIWEFSAAITPTSIGGAAVTAFVFSQEKLPAGKIAAILFYTIVLDSAFFLIGLPLLVFLVGPEVLSPGGQESVEFIIWRNTFFTAYVGMLMYASVFFYGIFIGPGRIRQLLVWMTSFHWTQRFRKRADQIGMDMLLTSEELRRKTFWFHLVAMIWTFLAWSIRFILVMCIMAAFVPFIMETASFAQQLLLYGRLQIMFIVLALSPTPGGVGIAEAAFGPFLSDFIIDSEGNYLAGMAIIVAFLWRLLTYYFYLLSGAIILPNWIRKVINRRRANQPIET